MTTPGPGDPETWGPPTGHPNDPRTEDELHFIHCEVFDGGECDCGMDEPDYEPDYEAIAESIEYERSQSALYRMDQEY